MGDVVLMQEAPAEEAGNAMLLYLQQATSGIRGWCRDVAEVGVVLRCYTYVFGTVQACTEITSWQSR